MTNVSSIGGLWSYPSMTFPEHDDFMFIDEERQRIVSFIVFRDVNEDRRRRGSMPNWFKRETATSITARLRPTDEWRTFEFQHAGDRLSWTLGGVVQAWQRVAWEQRPD